MVRIERNGRLLELYPGTKITFKMRSSLLTEDVIPLTYSLPFKLPLKGTANAVLLDFPAHPQRKGGIQPMDVTIYFKDGKPRKGILKINTVNDDFAEANITVDKSLEDIANQKLPELLQDIHPIEIESFKQTIEIRVVVNDLVYPGYIANGQPVSITVNGQEFSTPAQSTLNVSFARIMYEALRDQINNASLGVTAAVLGDSFTNIRLQIQNDTSGTNSLFTLDLNKYLDLYASQAAWYWAVYEEEDWINNHITAIRNAINAHDGNTFMFAPVKNPKFSDDERYPGWQNVHFNYNLSNKEDISGFITPFPRLYSVITEIMKKLGYKVSNNYISTGSFSKIYLYSNVAADAWVKIYGNVVPTGLGPFSLKYEYDQEINIHASVMRLGDYLPDISARDFLNAIKSLFNLEIKYNPNRAEVTILPARLQAKDLMSAAPDMTPFAILPLEFTSPEVEATTIKSLGFEVDSSDALNQSLQDWQQPILVNANGNKEIVAKVSSIRDEILTIPYPQNTADSSVGPACTVEISGVIKGNGSRSKIKLMLYRGRIGLINMPLATSRNTAWPFYSSSAISLEWSGASGLYEMFWKNFVQLRNDNTMMRCTMTYPPEILSRLDDLPAQFIKGSLYVWKEGDLSPEEVAADKAKMLFVLI